VTFSLLQITQTDYGDHPVSYLLRIAGSFLGVTAGGA